MSVGAAIRITSVDEERVIRHAAELARQQGSPCYVISIVRELPHGDVVKRNLELIAQMTEPRFVGVFGEPRVNVLGLNLAMAEMRRR